jgi:DNA repair protein RadA/Sms
MRADRLGLKGKNLYLLTENNLDKIFKEIDRVKPEILIVDSIQTVYADSVSSSPGSVSQVKESALSLINKAKSEGISVIMVGHVNKEGGIAGPKVLEHMVDAVLYFEGDRRQTYRIIRAIKNRFGSTNEIGVFEMTERGLVQIPNPSEMLLADRPKNASGNCAVCIMEGTRPIIAEVQALVSTTSFPAPRRTTNGMDYNRMCLVLAVLEKRLGLRFSANDVYINVIGGLEIDDPGTDMATALALISSLTDKVVPSDLVAFGELGLAGECRAVSELERKVNEAARLGFTQAIVPERNYEKLHVPSQIKLIPVKSVYEAIRVLVKADEE